MWAKLRRFFHEWNLPQTLAIGLFEHREKLERKPGVKQPNFYKEKKYIPNMYSKFIFQGQYLSSPRTHRQTDMIR